jgi:hypothetical protein
MFGRALEPEPADALGELIGAHLCADAIPARGLPQLEVVGSPDHHRIRLQVSEVAQAGRQDKSALAVELDLERARKEEAREGTGTGVGIALSAGRVGKLLPRGFGKDRDAVLEPSTHRRPGGQIGAKARGHGYPALAVNRVPVLAGEHTPTSSLVRKGDGKAGLSPPGRPNSCQYGYPGGTIYG